MEANDADAPDHDRRALPATASSGGHPTPGSPLVDPGDHEALRRRAQRLASNFLVVEPVPLGHAASRWP